jgi:hypothetical protein
VVSGLDGGGCVIVTRDGLALGAYPASEEGRMVSRWAELGSGATSALRGFLVLEGESWVIATGRRYAAVAKVGLSARPGLVLQRLEDALEGLEGAPGAQGRPLGPFHEVRAPTLAAPEQRAPVDHIDVPQDVLEVARVLGRLAVPSSPAEPIGPWSVPDPAGSIGA